MQQAVWLSVIRTVQAAGWDEATLNKMLVIELNNGRTTHMGILGAREVEQQPLHHQLPARLPRALLNSC